MAELPSIVRIVEVKDTRQYEEGPDDKWYPIPGSGDLHECARCGRIHEIHWTVQLSDGTLAVLGGRCAHAAVFGVASKATSIEGLAKKIARTTRELAAVQQRIRDFAVAEAEVRRLPVPRATIEPFTVAYGRIFRAVMGDASVIVHPLPSGDPEFNTERKEALLDGWFMNRMRERLPGVEPLWSLRNDVERIEVELAKAQAKMQKLTA